MNSNEIKGKGMQIKGSMKEKVGEIIGDPDLRDEGQAHRTEGKVQQNEWARYNRRWVTP